MTMPEPGRSAISRLITVGLSGLLGAAMLLATAVPALAAVPSLQGESFFQAFPSVRTVSCNPLGISTISMSASGTATGPYPGTFTETITVTIDSAAQPGMNVAAPLLTAEASFTIDSPVGQVSGTKSLRGGYAEGLCQQGTLVVGNNGNINYTGQVYYFFAELSYEATITAATGAFVDRGRANASFSYSNTAVLDEQGRCCISTTGSNFNEQFLTSTGVTPVGPGDPASVVLTPPAATNTVGTAHTVTATVSDAAGQANPGVTVRFTVSGSSNTSGSCTTDAAGRCSFTYTGPSLAGADLIVACADTDNDGVRDATEPCGEATKAWLLPSSTPGQVTGGGHVLNPADGEEVAFGFNGKSEASGIKGNCTVVDKAPVRNVKIKCLTVDTLVQTGNSATLFGQAEINGVATTYRNDVTDNGEPGAGRDTFAIQTASGYSAGGVLDNGNVQVHQ